MSNELGKIGKSGFRINVGGVAGIGCCSRVYARERRLHVHRRCPKIRPIVHKITMDRQDS
jgi:hypothetical protein